MTTYYFDFYGTSYITEGRYKSSPVSTASTCVCGNTMSFGIRENVVRRNVVGAKVGALAYSHLDMFTTNFFYIKNKKNRL